MAEIKFGLEEYWGLQKALGTALKKSDARVVQLILGVTGVPNTLLEETHAALARRKGAIAGLVDDLASNRARDVSSKATKRVTIALAKTTRISEKRSLAEARTVLTKLSTAEEAGKADLEGIVRLFSGNVQ